MVSPQTILIVDDSAEDRYMYARYLRQDSGREYEIVEAETGQDALEICERVRVDAILLDYLLPDATGLEVLAGLRGHWQGELPIIMLTGQGNEEIAVSALKAGAQDYLVKGQLTPPKLQRSIAAVIDRVRLQAQLREAEAERMLRMQHDRSIARVAQQIHRSLDLQEVLQTTVDEVRQFLQTDRVVILRLQAADRGIVLTESVGEEWHSLLGREFVDDCFASEPIVTRYRQGRSSAISDIDAAGLSACHRQLLAGLQVRANAIVPILQEDRLWGLLAAHHCSSPRQWQPLEIDLVAQLAIHAGIAIQQAELYQQSQARLVERDRSAAQLRERIDRERLVAHIAQRIRQTLNLAEILNKTATEVRQFLKCDRVFIYRFHDDFSGTIEVESVGEGWQTILATAIEDSYFTTNRGRDYLGGRIQAIDDIYSTPLTDCHRQLLERFQVRANLAVPILQGNNLWGLLVANQCSQPRGWQPLEIDLLGLLATQVGIAIQQSEFHQQVQIARERAERANRVKDEFLALLSHELRTPLSPILGWSQLLRSGKLDPSKTDRALATIERNAKLQSQLIEDLLDVSRILAGKLVLQEIEEVDLAIPIAAALQTIDLAAQAKQITVRSEFPTAPAVVAGDGARLQQVMWNLLANAVKFTPPGGQIEVRLAIVGDTAEIVVIDTGKGISAEFLPQVFDYFQQEDAATTRKYGGLGLGLAIVRQLVELHGGTVTAASAGEDRGATFAVSLPLLAPTMFGTEASHPLASALTSTAVLAGTHILVVDDDPDARELIAYILERDGAKVTTADSAISALQQLVGIGDSLTLGTAPAESDRRALPDLLISDIGMPEMDGYTLMERICLQLGSRHLPAIALTAYAGAFDRDRAFQAGFQHHLAKPIDSTVLVDLAAKILDRAN